MKRRVVKTQKATMVRPGPSISALPMVDVMRQELSNMTDVLVGRVPMPIDVGPITLLEVADAYYSRAQEFNMRLHEAELDGQVRRGSKHYLFRTGELRDFLELSRHAAERGSRRLTALKLKLDSELKGREYVGGR